jgi:hypothetical protein
MVYFAISLINKKIFRGSEGSKMKIERIADCAYTMRGW